MSTAETHQEIISIIGSQYFAPIAQLVDKWVDRRPVRRDSVGAPFYEGGYAVSVIILLVAALESYVEEIAFSVKSSLAGCMLLFLNIWERFIAIVVLHDSLNYLLCGTLLFTVMFGC